MAGARAVRATVEGSVQGVGFREGVRRRAGGLGVLGWVRNCDDGAVAVHAEGPADAVAQLLDFLRDGPRGARVAGLKSEDVAVEGHEQFAIRGVSAGVFVVQQHAATARLDAGANPTSDTDRRAYDLIGEGFGPGANGPLTVVLPVPSGQSQTLPASVQQTLQKTPGVASVSTPQVNPAGDTAVMNAIPTTGPQDAATTDLVDNLRDNVLPGVGTTAYVTGTTAGYVDFTERAVQRLPWLIGAVVLLSLLLLTAAFRSLAIGLKAAAMNLLSVGAAYGVVVAVFQWGWGSSLVGLDETVPIPAFVPMLMFAIVFGLSMDYEVFLLSRVHEA